MANGESQESRILQRIELLLSRYHERDLAYDLDVVSDYYAFLADRIDYEHMHVDSARPLLETFESVFLWMKDALLQYPETIRQQVLDIIEEKQLCEIISIIANLSDSHLRRLQRRGFLGRLPRLNSFLGISFVLPPKERDYLSPTKLFDAKLGLKRLSQILRFASTVKVTDYDETFRDFRDNYDPNLIDKDKLLALTHILRVQLNEAPESRHTKLVLERLDAIESELKKSRVRWGIVITGFFVLYGFFADIETLHPGAFNRATQTVKNILNVLHQDGGVQKATPRIGQSQSRSPDDDDRVPPKQTGLLTEEIKIRDDENDEPENDPDAVV
ncbi:hypothetical protein [uncultured Rubinisphaera sp.]|uniref:hypothetical protein n=1 Tax=uncultured Rubinisphaera sp. TaxID=1678686 RepID=UPI0030D79561|tara:strand:+ start:744 stop:1733 length:990 start_codon:yes stop_codon:yes gene_type:complete